MKKHILAFDFGSSFGRAVFVHFNGTSLRLEEIHKFEIEPVSINGHLYWDILHLIHEMKTALLRASLVGDFDSIGIDTWGGDFGLLDRNEVLLSNPYSFRDIWNIEGIRKIANSHSQKELYRLTGTQITSVGSLSQILAYQKRQPELFKIARTMLPLPDLLVYFLTGIKATEPSIAATTQLMNPATKKWSDKVCENLGIPIKILPPITLSGTWRGRLSPEICKELNISPVNVATICGNSTQCDVLAVPAKEPDFIFISCGILSSFGTELDKPILSEQAAKFGFSNEVGFKGKINFLKKITGLWLIQEIRRYFRNYGKSYSFSELEQQARKAPPLQCFIDPDSQMFSLSGNIPELVQEYCRKTDQYIPRNIGEIMRCIYESLALKYHFTLLELKACTGKEYNSIYITGGGAKDRLLCQLIADACQIPVMTGPVNATIYGNAMMQFMTSNVIPDIESARELIAGVEPVKKFFPNSEWFDAYDTFGAILKKNIN